MDILTHALSGIAVGTVVTSFSNKSLWNKLGVTAIAGFGALLPDFENLGIGRELLDRTSKELAKLGHARLFLGCSPDPRSRSYGFYRHLGWRSTGTYDQYGDEILEIFVET